MAAADRVKINRKALREPDEFQTLTAQLVAWVDEHRSLFVAAAVGAAVAVAVIAGVRWYRGTQSEAAALQFQQAQKLFDESKFAEASDAFGAIADHYGSTSFGSLASLYRGHALARKGDAAAAAGAYDAFLAAGPPTDYLRQAALSGLAHQREIQGDGKGALDAYTEAGTLSGPYRNDAKLGAARLHEAAGQTDQAKALYKELLAADPDPELRTFLQAKVPDAATPPKP